MNEGQEEDGGIDKIKKKMTKQKSARPVKSEGLLPRPEPRPASRHADCKSVLLTPG